MTGSKRSIEAQLHNLAKALVRIRTRSQLTQSQIAVRMGTTQTAIARLESGRQNISVETLQNYAHASGFCLEIGFIESLEPPDGPGCVLVVENRTQLT